ncbi:MAG TPA: TRAP transporter substrate-binding protein DctP [Hyphomicrobiaceae bacterium]|jgi:TRAP-type C4-dicarboxylate transport system substrate-binding protein
MTQPLRILSCAALLALPLSAAYGQSVELRYATSAPPKTVWEMQVVRFQKQVEDASKGSLKINAFLNSQLGSEQDTVQQVARGRIDMGGYSVTAGSLLVPELSLLNIPFLFKDQKEQDCVTDNHLTKVTQDLFLKKGVVMISWSEVGVADIIGKKPYLTPDDLKGLKARSAPNKVAGYMWTQFGANPNPLPVTEWNSAFQTGLIDVADSAPTFYFFSGLAKLAPVVTMTQHQDQGGVVIMNKEAFDKLTPEHKAALTGTSTSAPASQLRAEVRGFEGKIREMHKAAGGTIVELTPEQRAVWRKGIEAAWPKMVEAVGGEAGAYWKAIQSGIKACSP